jgi:HTH-type transcriptional regulator/antitoxin HigA
MPSINEGGGNMAAIAEVLSYEDLLRLYKPAVIKSKEQNRKALRLLTDLMSKGEASLSPAEQRFIELLAALVSDFERRAFQSNRAAPADVLRELMRARNLKPRDLWPVFGSKGITSEVLRGKRGISKERAKMLAEKFCVSAELFI